MDTLLVAVLGSVALCVLGVFLLIRALWVMAPPRRLARPARKVLIVRILRPALRLIEPLAGVSLSREALRRSTEAIARAGLAHDLRASEFRALQMCSSVAWALFVGLVQFRIPGALEPISLAVASVTGFLWPGAWLRQRARVRLERARRQLPFLIDLVAMSVESGLPIGAALAQAVDRSPGGPLREEFLRAIGELKAGRSREEALTALSERVAQPALTQFVLALLAIQRDGGSVVHMLKTIAEQQRTDRLVRAEHQAMQAPVKLMFPLVLFIFPGTFAILLYPVLARVIAQGGLW
jgi:tight adherence protein C